MSMSIPQRTLIHRIAAFILEYPDEDLLARLPSLRTAIAGLDEPFQSMLERIVGYLAHTPAPQLAAHHVATFAVKPCCCPCPALDFAADADPVAGTRMLVENRVEVERLRVALTGAGSPYADALAAVILTLPPLDGTDRTAAVASGTWVLHCVGART